MTIRQLLDDPLLLRGGHHCELRLLWHRTIFSGDDKRQSPLERLICPRRMGLRRGESYARMRFDFSGQDLGQGRIDIGSEVINGVIRDSEIQRGLQQVSELVPNSI